MISEGSVLCYAKLLHHVRLFANQWAVVHQALLSMGFSRQAYWSGLPFPPPRDLPDPGIEPTPPVSLALQVGSLLLEPWGKPLWLFFSLCLVWLFTTPWAVARQAPLSSTVCWSLLRFMSVESVMLSNHLILAALFFCLPSLPASGSFPMSQLFTSGGQSSGVSASASVLPMHIQGWFSLGLRGLISLQSKGLSRAFPNTTVQKHQFFGTQPALWSNSHIHTWLLEKP